MKFSSFRLTGFKSFVEPTEVSIEGGLTGIVGPNGCGKSNLVEALQWVMGENSYKAMRGSGMEDVIFSGSTARPARNSAEVALTLDNSDRDAPASHNDSDTLSVTRRIERDTGSSYRINGREVRAKDVQLLFADASIGAHSAAIVGQGRVGSLIAAKPEARRRILEEAAGIHGLFGRRQEAESRLKAAEQNLDRLEDVLSEIERQAETLRRQARQAVRYRNLSGEIRKAEATALVVRHQHAEETVAAAGTELDQATRIVTDVAGTQVAAAKAQADAASNMPAIRDRAVAADAAMQRLRIEADRLEREQRTVQEQIDALGKRLEQLTADLTRERALLDDGAGTLERLAADRARIQSEGERHDSKLHEATEKLTIAEHGLFESERLMADAGAALADLRARRNQAQREIETAVQRESRLQTDLAAAIVERQSLPPEAGGERIAAAQQAIVEAETALVEAEQVSIAAEEQSGSARDRVTSARSTLTEAEAGLGRLEAEANALRSLLPASTTDAPLIDSIRMREEGVDAALAALLGEDLDLSNDASDPAHWRMVAAEADPSLPVGVRPLTELVDGPDVLKRRLAQTGLVDKSDGEKLQAELKPGQSLVSREGDLWRWDGLTASAEVRKSEAERLAARRRLAAIVRDIDAESVTVADTRVALSAAEDGAGNARRTETEAREAWRAAQRILDQRRSELSNVERERSAHASRVAALDEARSRLQAGLDEAVSTRQSAETALAELADPSALEAPIESLRHKVSTDRETVAEARSQLSGIERDGRTRGALLANLEQEEAAWAGRTAGAQQQIDALEQRINAANVERQSLADRPDEIAAQLRALETQVETAGRDRSIASDALAIAESALAAADKAIAAANADLSEAREKRGRLEERLTGAKERLAEIVGRIREAMDCTPEQAVEIAGLNEKTAPALDQIEGRLERLKQERERLGAVNLQADQEVEELDTRRATMIADRDDLVAAINKLRQGIGNLNREGRERMVVAFETVNTQFQRLFAQLFGGGTAELKLVGSDDPLQAGLEIIAKPPGKKPQTMTLLSGGEQALTALSLIFAVFLTNPAPVCVLDEVDAPLDDANVERFCALLDEITREAGTRFLVITHNPITMARMNRLFGVTMTERGVSQLVSVDLEAAEHFLEAS